jgi:hypothetical protein
MSRLDHLLNSKNVSATETASAPSYDFSPLRFSGALEVLRRLFHDTQSMLDYQHDRHAKHQAIFEQTLIAHRSHLDDQLTALTRIVISPSPSVSARDLNNHHLFDQVHSTPV